MSEYHMVTVKPRQSTVYDVAGHVYVDLEKACEFAAALSIFNKYDSTMSRSEMPLELFIRLARYMVYVIRETSRRERAQREAADCNHTCEYCRSSTVDSNSNGAWCTQCGSDV